MTTHLPEVFAIVRQAYRGPCLQILHSHATNNYMSRTHLRDRDPYFHVRPHQQSLIHEVQSVHDITEFLDARLTYSNTMDSAISVYCILQPDGETSALVKGWYLPYYFRMGSRRIPIMDFQMRAWIPGDYTPVPIHTNLNEFLQQMEDIQRDCLRDIQMQEDIDSTQNRNYYDFPGPNRHADDYNYSRREVRRMIPVTPPPRIVETVRLVEVPVERIVTQMKALPLPKDIGDILLANARKGQECCPIAATPFADCETLCVSSCFHIFDKASLARWQEDHTTCPVCRCKIENVVYETRVDAAAVSEV